MKFHLYDILVVLHLLWATFMIGGFVLAVVGIFQPACRRLVKLRTAHVIGIVLTASVPLWSGICPLTDWENALRTGAGLSTIPRSFLAHYANRILYINVAGWLITLLTSLVAVVSLILYFVYPPWKGRNAPLSKKKQSDCPGYR